jgi:hypothetical protein
MTAANDVLRALAALWSEPDAARCEALLAKSTFWAPVASWPSELCVAAPA